MFTLQPFHLEGYCSVSGGRPGGWFCRTHIYETATQDISVPLRWRHNELDGVSDHQPHDCLLNCLFGRRSKKTSKLCVTGLCAGNSPGTGEFPAQRASNAENVSIWWRHHAKFYGTVYTLIVLSDDHIHRPNHEPMRSAYLWNYFISSMPIRLIWIDLMPTCALSGF